MILGGYEKYATMGGPRASRLASQAEEDELLFLTPVASEHVEEYLEALWMMEERGERIAKISDVSRLLRVSAPSVVEMLKRLKRQGYVDYLPREGVRLTPKGRKIGRRMVRNGRLVEAFMKEALHIKVDVKVAHAMEHQMSQEFADALCSLLNHPKRCPHTYLIPEGRCCR